MSKASYDNFEWISVQFECSAKGKIATVALTNQKKHNAISSAVITDLTRVFKDLAKDDDLRVVVLRGAGDKAFAAGADINVMRGLDPAGGRAFITSLHLAIDAIRRMPVPVIGQLHGYCFGAAVEIAAACDFRAGDKTLVIGMPEVKVGIPSVIEAALLPNLIGWGKTREMLLTGANYTAQEAYEMGFLQQLTTPDELLGKVRVWVDHILDSGPIAVRSQKALMARWEKLDLDSAIKAGIEHFGDAFLTDEPELMMAKRLGPRK